MMGWMAPLRHRRAKLVFSRITRNREPSMSEITTIGLDLAKHVFQVHGIDAQGTTVLRKRLRRGQVLALEPEREKPATHAISDSPSVRSANQERQALPVASDEKGALSIARRRKR